jgi:hypothetical protein
LVVHKIIFIPDYTLPLAEPLLFFGLLITIVATPFITFELSEGQNAMLTGALGVAWGYGMIEIVALWSQE